MRSHSKALVDAYVATLRKCGAPEGLIAIFERLVDIDNNLPRDQDNLEKIELLLLDACRRYGFSEVFSDDGRRRWLRPSTIDTANSAYSADSALSVDDFDPKIEQAYRRGFSQGFAFAEPFVEASKRSGYTKHQESVDEWRRSKLYLGATFPGSDEPWGVKISIRRTIPASMRFRVLKRDKSTCQTCGAKAPEVPLHVDHIIPVAKGGLTEEGNLQILCCDCNLGKGAS